MMTPGNRLRLLPWSGPEGKPCYLSSDGTGHLSRLADAMESTQLDLADELLQEAKRVLDGRQWTSGELHLFAMELIDALANVHRIAVSRGERLPAPAYEGLNAIDDEDDQLDTPYPTQRA